MRKRSWPGVIKDMALTRSNGRRSAAISHPYQNAGKSGGTPAARLAQVKSPNCGGKHELRAR